jgi:hypothetical protein
LPFPIWVPSLSERVELIRGLYRATLEPVYLVSRRPKAQKPQVIAAG